jgi:Gas vesicle synthesis protein GvpL/GvpF
VTTPSHRGAEVAPDPGDRGLFVYAVVPADLEPPGDLHGLDDEPLRLVRHGRVAAVVSDMALVRPAGRRADLTAYTQVVESLASAGPAAPVQFGAVALGEEALEEDLLGPAENDLAEVLEILRGRVQYNLKASYVEDVVLAEVVSADPTIRELRERTRLVPDDAARADKMRLGELVSQALEDKGADDGGLVLDTVLPLVEDHVVRPSSPEHPLDVALLVADERQDELVDRLEELAEAVHERIRLSLVGPLPGYDFTGGAAWAS